jgi:hypothetical protein
MLRRIPTLLAIMSLLLWPLAPALAAEGPTPAEQAAVLQPADLPGGPELTMGSFAFKSGGGTPTIYLESTDNEAARGTRSQRAVVQRAASDVRSWESSTYIYSAASSAATSYARLKDSVARLSRPLVHSADDEEGYVTSVILGDVPVFLKAKAGMPRFAVDSFVVGRSDGPDVDPLDRYSYVVVYRAGRAVVQVGVQSARPLTPDQMEAIRDATLEVAKRAAAIR